MVSEEQYKKITDLINDTQRESVKQQVYYDINRELKNSKKGRKFIDIFHKMPTILITVNKELLENGYFTTVLQDAVTGDLFLRMYLRDLT